MTINFTVLVRLVVNKPEGERNMNTIALSEILLAAILAVLIIIAVRGIG